MKKDQHIGDKFNLGQIKPIDLEIIMDFVNGYLIKYYTLNDLERPTFLTLVSIIEKKYKRYNNVHVELALNIMEHDGYIKLISQNESDDDQIFHHTEKGLSKYFEGGFRKEIKRKMNERLLVNFAQISVILAGLYYFIEIIKSILSFICAG